MALVKMGKKNLRTYNQIQYSSFRVEDCLKFQFTEGKSEDVLKMKTTSQHKFSYKDTKFSLCEKIEKKMCLCLNKSSKNSKKCPNSLILQEYFEIKIPPPSCVITLDLSSHLVQWNTLQFKNVPQCPTRTKETEHRWRLMKSLCPNSILWNNSIHYFKLNIAFFSLCSDGLLSTEDYLMSSTFYSPYLHLQSILKDSDIHLLAL